jgi:flagellar hook assembly protein FlgD
VLFQNYPNPFNPETVIRYGIRDTGYGINTNHESRITHPVSLKIYNTTGQLVKTLVDKEQSAGYYSVKWNGKDDNNKEVSSGIYIYRLKVYNNIIATKYMVLVK